MEEELNTFVKGAARMAGLYVEPTLKEFAIRAGIMGVTSVTAVVSGMIVILLITLLALIASLFMSLTWQGWLLTLAAGILAVFGPVMVSTLLDM